MELLSPNLIRALKRLGFWHGKPGRVRLDGGAAHEPEGSVGLKAPGTIGVSPLTDERWCQGRSNRRRGAGGGNFWWGRPVAGAVTKQQHDAKERAITIRRHTIRMPISISAERPFWKPCPV